MLAVSSSRAPFCNAHGLETHLIGVALAACFVITLLQTEICGTKFSLALRCFYSLGKEILGKNKSGSCCDNVNVQICDFTYRATIKFRKPWKSAMLKQAYGNQATSRARCLSSIRVSRGAELKVI